MKLRSTLSQVLASTAKNVIIFACGLSLGFPTIVIPSVYNVPANATLRLTDEEVSWFGSVNYVTIPLGSIASGAISQKFGRKHAMQGLTIPLLISWVMFYYAESALVLCSAVALAGLAGGLLEVPVLTYISEISEPRLRGILSASAPLSTIFGIFTLYFMGNFIDWRTVSALCTIGPTLGFIMLFFVPESPHWLLSKYRIEDTQKALCWLRGWTTKEYIQDEYEELVREIHPDLKTTENRGEYNGRCNIKNYVKRTFILPFALILLAFAVNQFTGVTTLSTYSVNLFRSFGAPIDGYFATVMLGLARFFGTVVCMVLIHFTGKRPLAFTSVAAVGVLFGGVGLYGHFYLGLEKLDAGASGSENLQDASRYSWVPMVCFIGGSFFSYVGFRVLPWNLVGEVLPTEVRGFGSGICAGIGYLFGFIANKTFFDSIASLTLSGVFIMYGALAFASIPLFYFFLPETEGWTLLEVQEHFAGKRNLIKAGVKKTKNVDDALGEDNPVPVADDSTKL